MSDRFEIYQDKQNKYWVWCELTQTNLAIRAKTELDAYKEALNHCIFIAGLYKERRDLTEKKLEVLTKAFESIGDPDE
jgi:hypothetical protein